MNFERTITPTIVIGGQPTESDLTGLKASGFVGVVNLRNDGEPEQPIGTAAEGDKVRSEGLDYLHFGVGAAPLLEQDVDALCAFMDGHGSGKVLVHCRGGGRAGALVLLQQALKHGWSANEAALKGREMGLDVDGNLRAMVENYLDNHRKAGGI